MMIYKNAKMKLIVKKNNNNNNVHNWKKLKLSDIRLQ